mmetsp:Transcript_2090/g.6860  ORF Transcript_2090/g.6860 Transcript_2090/m.6860 type:complete len:255 (+) Transcript_2090:176-940(+)
MQRVWLILFLLPCTLTETSVMPKALRIFHMSHEQRVPDPARRIRTTHLVLAHVSSMSWKMVRPSKRSTCSSCLRAALHALTSASVASSSLPRPKPALPAPFPTTASTEMERFLPPLVTFDTALVCKTCAKKPPGGRAPASRSRTESRKEETIDRSPDPPSSSRPSSSRSNASLRPSEPGGGYRAGAASAAGPSSSSRPRSSARRRAETASSLSSASRTASSSSAAWPRPPSRPSPPIASPTDSSESSRRNSRSS